MIADGANSNNLDGLPVGVTKAVVATPIIGWPGRRLRWPDLRGLPRRATEVQG
jgi:hypothetical protein